MEGENGFSQVALCHPMCTYIHMCIHIQTHTKQNLSTSVNEHECVHSRILLCGHNTGATLESWKYFSIVFYMQLDGWGK